MALATILPGFKFGCDPELFIFDEDDQLVCATGVIPGSKEDPHPVPFGAVQPDGFAAEFNIEPAESFEEFDHNIEQVLGSLRSMIKPSWTLRAQASVHVPPNVFDMAPDKAKELGCSPDVDAWTGQINPPPHAPDDPYLRTGSGHLHIGWTEDQPMSNIDHINNCRDLVKQLDWYLGGWSVVEDPDAVRRKLYGKAGACRYKDYGVEYRVLSNFWVLDRKLREETWDRMVTAINRMNTNSLSYDPVFSKFNNQLIQSINETSFSPSFLTSFQFPVLSFK